MPFIRIEHFFDKFRCTQKTAQLIVGYNQHRSAIVEVNPIESAFVVYSNNCIAFNRIVCERYFVVTVLNYLDLYDHFRPLTPTELVFRKSLLIRSSMLFSIGSITTCIALIKSSMCAIDEVTTTDLPSLR